MIGSIAPKGRSCQGQQKAVTYPFFRTCVKNLVLVQCQPCWSHMTANGRIAAWPARGEGHGPDAWLKHPMLQRAASGRVIAAH